MAAKALAAEMPMAEGRPGSALARWRRPRRRRWRRWRRMRDAKCLCPAAFADARGELEWWHRRLRESLPPVPPAARQAPEHLLGPPHQEGEASRRYKRAPRKSTVVTASIAAGQSLP